MGKRVESEISWSSNLSCNLGATKLVQPRCREDER